MKNTSNTSALEIQICKAWRFSLYFIRKCCFCGNDLLGKDIIAKKKRKSASWIQDLKTDSDTDGNKDEGLKWGLRHSQWLDVSAFAFSLSLWINRAGQRGEAPDWSKAILPLFSMFCASAEGIVCVLPQTSFFWWSQSRMGVSLFRASLSRSWHLIEKVDLNNINLMKKVGSSAWGRYLNGRMVQLWHCSDCHTPLPAQPWKRDLHPPLSLGLANLCLPAMSWSTHG